MAGEDLIDGRVEDVVAVVAEGLHSDGQDDLEHVLLGEARAEEPVQVLRTGQTPALAPSSLYATFGSKRGVMKAALIRYDQDRDALLAPLEHGEEGLADIRRFLGQVRVGLETSDVPGCLMVNTAAGPTAHDEIIGGRARVYRTRLHDGLFSALNRAAGDGELLETRAEVLRRRATLLEATLCGLQVTKRNDDTESALEALGGILALLDDWSAVNP